MAEDINAQLNTMDRTLKDVVKTLNAQQQDNEDDDDNEVCIYIHRNNPYTLIVNNYYFRYLKLHKF